MWLVVSGYNPQKTKNGTLQTRSSKN